MVQGMVQTAHCVDAQQPLVLFPGQLAVRRITQELGNRPRAHIINVAAAAASAAAGAMEPPWRVLWVARRLRLWVLRLMWFTMLLVQRFLRP